MMRRTLRFLEKLVIVESPNKVIKVEGLLSDPKVVPDWSFQRENLRAISQGPERALAMATTGHFMALKELTWAPQPLQAKPASGDDFPPNGVLASFALEWEIMPGRKIQDTVSHYLEEKTRNITEIIIATDPDREGELIAVHALNLIRSMFPSLKCPFSRAYIHSITADGIRTAMRDRQQNFDYNLANAAEARHAMDRIFGFLGSSVVRFANPQMRSIGRVQTPALILIHEREAKIAHFLETHKPTFEVKAMATFSSRNGSAHTQLVSIKPDRTATVEWESIDAVKDLAARWQLGGSRGFQVRGTPVVTTSVSEPPEPFTMATLIAKANRQLYLSSEEVSSCLQDLFQMGHITYPRTDSSRIDESVIPQIHEAVRESFGQAMLYRLEDRREPKKKTAKRAKRDTIVEGNVEDAHEAIRPTDIRVTSESLGKSVAANTKSVYDLVRRHTLAAYMIPMKVERVSVSVGFQAGNGDELRFTLEGKHTKESGWSTAFRQGSGRASQALAENQLEAESLENGEVIVPRISVEEFTALTELKDVLNRKGGATIKLGDHQVQEHKLSPPLPFSEGGLIEELKNNGVGRPSTYPMIVKTLLARNYITVNHGRCETTEVGRMLVETSKSTFPSIVDVGFTSSFEQKLDRVAKPEQNDNKFLRSHKNLSEADYVLSSFVSRFLNYVTEATRAQRGNLTERSLTIKHDQLKEDGQADREEDFQGNVARERHRAMAQVPDVLENCKSYRTFTALQNSLNDYLRRNFPPSPVTQWRSPPNYRPKRKETTSYTTYSRHKAVAERAKAAAGRKK